MKWQLCLTALAVLCAQAVTDAALITYVDATSGVGGNTALSAGGVFTPTAALTNNDDNWSVRAFGNSGDVLTSNDSGSGDAAEDAPGLATTIAGLTPGNAYNVFAYFWDGNGNWRLKASLTQNPPLGNDLAISFSADGSATSTDTELAIAADFVASPLLVEGDRKLQQAVLGQAVANASGQIVVYIDDLENPTVSTTARTWYDGVGYSVVPEPASLGLLGLGILGLLAIRRRVAA